VADRRVARCYARLSLLVVLFVLVEVLEVGVDVLLASTCGTRIAGASSARACTWTGSTSARAGRTCTWTGGTRTRSCAGRTGGTLCLLVDLLADLL
jgi:hypothetical protein